MCRERDSDAAIGGLVRDRERECGGLGWVGLSTYSYSYREREKVWNVLAAVVGEVK